MRRDTRRLLSWSPRAAGIYRNRHSAPPVVRFTVVMLALMGAFLLGRASVPPPQATPMPLRSPGPTAHEIPGEPSVAPTRGRERTGGVSTPEKLPAYLRGFAMPIAGAKVPDNPRLWPGAKREYRHGVHQGVDFYVPYGTPVLAAKSGRVIRAEVCYVEMTPRFRDQLLAATRELGKTPRDILDLMYGRQVILDHGIVDGHRVITRYAHLSQIHPAVKVGALVRQGQIIGFVGNSGTSSGARGTRDDAHLHFEIWVNDRYLGEGMEMAEVGKLLRRVLGGN